MAPARQAKKDQRKTNVIFYDPQAPDKPDSKHPKNKEAIDTLPELKRLQTIEWEEKLMGRGKSKYRTIPIVADVDAVMLVVGRDGTECTTARVRRWTSAR